MSELASACTKVDQEGMFLIGITFLSDRLIMLKEVKQSMKKILITGTTGFLGSRIAAYYSTAQLGTDYEVIPLGRGVMDFLNPDSIKSAFDQHPADVLIHCAAISDIGECEKNPELSYQINVKGPENLAKACKDHGIRLLFCSSDQVYAGTEGKKPHSETECLSPPHHYGRQKLEAEQRCMEQNENSLCFRLSWMYDHPRQGLKEHGNLLTSIQEAIREKRNLTYPANDFRSITYAYEVAKQTRHALTAAPGIYNFGSPGNYSAFEIASRMLTFFGESGIQILPVESEFQSTERNLRMDMKKASEAGFTFVDVMEGIHACMNFSPSR